MNIQNLKRIRNYIQSIPEDRIDMRTFGSSSNILLDFRTKEIDPEAVKELTDCNTVACIIGHSIILDLDLYAEIAKENAYKSTNCTEWATKFCELDNTYQFSWLFGPTWHASFKTVADITVRLNYAIEHNSIPINALKQIKSGVFYNVMYILFKHNLKYIP